MIYSAAKHVFSLKCRWPWRQTHGCPSPLYIRIAECQSIDLREGQVHERLSLAGLRSHASESRPTFRSNETVSVNTSAFLGTNWPNPWDYLRFVRHSGAIPRRMGRAGKLLRGHFYE